MTRRLTALCCVLSILLSLFVGCRAAEDAPKESDNRFVSADEKQAIVKKRTSFTPDEPLALTVNGVQAVYESDKNAYFFSVTADDEWEVLDTAVDGFETAYTTRFDKKTKSSFLKDNRAVSLLAYDDERYVILSVFFTSLPLLSLNTKQLPKEYTYHDDGEDYEVFYDEDDEPIPYDPYAAPPDSKNKPIGNYETFLELTLLDPLAKEHGYENGFTSMARAHIRGRSSRAYPKNSYKIELLKEDNGVLVERDKTLLGMRADGDWNLNGMYAEPTKVRDKVASDLWLAMTADYESEGLSTGYRCEYIEVIINGHYHGLYLMTERIDRKQMGLTDDDLMYFSEGDLGKRYQDFLRCEDDEMEVSGYALKWPKERSAPYTEWEPFADFVKLIDATKISTFDDTAADMIDIKSLANYELFVQAATATDNLIQNTYYVARQQEDGSYYFSFVPWDMDQTFGNRWHGEEPLLTGEDYWGSLEFGCRFWVANKMNTRNAGGYKDYVRERYATLRKTVLSTKNLQKMVEDANASIVNSGAFMRNSIRWDMGAYNSTTYALTDYIASRMKYLDAIYL